MIAATRAAPILTNELNRSWFAAPVNKTGVEGLGAGVYAKLAANEPVVVAPTAPTLMVTVGDVDTDGITIFAVVDGVGRLKELTTLLQNASAAGST